MGRLVEHGQERHAPPGGQLLRYADGRPITHRRIRQPQQLRRQPRLPRRRPNAYRTEYDGLDPFQHKGSRPFSARKPEDPRSAARVFRSK